MIKSKNNLGLSVVIPIYNEEETLEMLFKKLKSILDSLLSNYEIIFIDDGSTDKSLEILTKLGFTK